MSSNNEAKACPTDSPQSVEESLEETVESYLPTMARLKAAEKAVMLEDLRRLARSDREKVRKLEAKRLWGLDDVSDVEESDMGDVIVTGDIHVGDHEQAGILAKLLGRQQSEPQLQRSEAGMPGWAKLVGAALAIAGIGAAGVAAYNVLKNDEAPVPVPAAQQGDKWIEYDVGKWVPGEPDASDQQQSKDG